ncbi:MAG: PAC2 family protein [Nitrososphaerales archaeon]
MSAVGVDVVQTGSIESRSPYVFVGLPDAGLVGTIAVSYLVDSFDMNELGYIDSARFPPMVIVRESEVKYAVRIYGRDKYLVVISEIPLSPAIATQFSKSLLEWLKNIGAKLVVNITGLPVQNRMQIEKPEVLGLASTKDVKDLLRSQNIALFNDGVLFGPYAAIIKECISQKVPVMTLFAQSHLNFPDPTASIEALSVVNKVLNVDIDLKPLKDEAEIIRIKTRELMRQTEGALKEAKIEGQPTIYR